MSEGLPMSVKGGLGPGARTIRPKKKDQIHSHSPFSFNRSRLTILSPTAAGAAELQRITLVDTRPE
jgi:hypothetical protein